VRHRIDAAPAEGVVRMASEQCLPRGSLDIYVRHGWQIARESEPRLDIPNQLTLEPVGRALEVRAYGERALQRPCVAEGAPQLSADFRELVFVRPIGQS